MESRWASQRDSGLPSPCPTLFSLLGILAGLAAWMGVAFLSSRPPGGRAVQPLFSPPHTWQAHPPSPGASRLVGGSPNVLSHRPGRLERGGDLEEGQEERIVKPLRFSKLTGSWQQNPAWAGRKWSLGPWSPLPTSRSSR